MTEIKCLTKLSVYDLASESHEVYASLSNDKNILIEVMNEDESIMYTDKIHPAAWESLVHIARQIIYWYDHINKFKRD